MHLTERARLVQSGYADQRARDGDAFAVRVSVGRFVRGFYVRRLLSRVHRLMQHGHADAAQSEEDQHEQGGQGGAEGH